jgi:hypothetical protein
MVSQDEDLVLWEQCECVDRIIIKIPYCEFFIRPCEGRDDFPDHTSQGEASGTDGTAECRFGEKPASCDFVYFVSPSKVCSALIALEANLISSGLLLPPGIRII